MFFKIRIFCFSTKALGNTSTYSFTWSNAATTRYIYTLGSGNYTVTVSESISACQEVYTRTIINPDSLIVNTTIAPMTCIGSNDAVITANVVGGTPGYYYSWSNIVFDPINPNLSAGTYTLNVHDAVNCIAQPIIITVNPSNTPCVGTENNTLNNVAIFPNPVTNQKINIQGLESGEYLINIHDAIGKQQHRQIASVQSGDNLLLQCNNLPPSTYILSLYNTKTQQNSYFKIIIQ